MGKREVIIGFLIVILFSIFVYFKQKQKPSEVGLKVPETSSIEDKIEQKFNITIPEDLTRIELKDVTGSSSSAIVTINDKKQPLEIAILADLPDLEQDFHYQAWLLKDDPNTDIISMGQLDQAKGGWVLDYKTSKDLSGYKNVVVSKEKNLDNQIETKFLEGVFK